MGSVNDLVLRRSDTGLRPAAAGARQQVSWTEEDRDANDRLHELAEVIWSEAAALRTALRTR